MIDDLIQEYDLVVLGGGPAGTPVAMEYAKLHKDKKIALVDKLGTLGGECLFDGCIPSKIMQVSAKYVKSLKLLKEFGVVLDETHYTLAWEKIVQRKESILKKRSEAAKNILLSFENIDLFHAEASFIDHEKLLVRFEDETTSQIVFDKCVVATGSKAFIPEYKGDGASKIWTNEDFFQRMELPSSLSIIGDGPIAIEFTQILSSFGVKINLIGRRASILKHIDEEFAHHILKELQNNKNVNLILNATVQQIDYKDDFELTYKQGLKEHTLHSQRVMVATGRVANISELNLENAQVLFDHNGIKTDEHLQTSNKNIYANGDVVEKFPKFAHTAQYGAHTIAQNLFLQHNFFKVDFDKNSWVLFSEPNIVMAGISKEEAQRRGEEVLVGVYDYAIDAKSQIEEEARGYLKFIVSKKNYKILGVSIMTHEANAIAGEAALIVSQSLGLSDLISTIHPHPTLSESFSVLAKQMMGEIMQEKLKSPFVKGVLELERFL